MQVPTWIKPGLYGAAIGAIALAVVGFSWGGWVTGSTAQNMAQTASKAAVVKAMTPYCVARSKNDPQSASIMEEFKKAPAYSRDTVIEKAGWATLLGSDKPNSALADACVTALTPT